MSIVKEFNLLLRERAVALRFRRFASGLASPAIECRSAAQRGKLWARDS